MVILLLALTAPARLLLVFTEGQPLELSEASGSIWSGTALARYQDTQLGTLHWNLSPFHLLTGQLRVDSLLRGEYLTVQSVSTLSTTTNSHLLNGEIELALINPLLVQYEIQVTGSLLLEGVAIELDESTDLAKLDGTVHWGGGNAKFRLLTVLNDVDLDPATGLLSSKAPRAQLSVLNQDQENQMLGIELETDTGWLHVSIFTPFLEYVGAPPIRLSRDSDFLFQISEKIY